MMWSEILSWERWRKNDTKWYSQILWNCFRIQFRSVHIRGSIPKTRVCFVTPPTFKSSILTARNEFRYLGSRAQREKGVGKPAGLCLWEHSEEKGWLVMVLTRFCGYRGGVFDLSPFLLPPSPSIYIYIYTCITLHPFLFPSSTSLPINILSASYPRSLFSFPPRYPLFNEPTFLFLPLFLFHLFPSYLLLTCFYPTSSLSTYNISISFSISVIVYETEASPSLSPSLIPTERNVGVERGWLVAQGCQTPSHATTKLPLKGDPAMAAGLVVFRFRGELHSLLPSRSPVPTPPGSRRGGNETERAEVRRRASDSSRRERDGGVESGGVRRGKAEEGGVE